MSDEPTNLVLELLRAIRADTSSIQRALLEHGRRLTAIEIGLSRVRRDAAGDAEMTALESARVDGIEEPSKRLEHRLELRD